MAERNEDRLVRAQRAALERARQKFYEKKLDDAAAALEEMQIGEKIAAASRSMRRRRIVPILLVATPTACICLVALLLFIRLSSSAIECDVVSSQVSMSFESPWILQDSMVVRPGEFTVTGSGRLNFPLMPHKGTFVGAICVQVDSSDFDPRITEITAHGGLTYQTMPGPSVRIQAVGENSTVVYMAAGHILAEIIDYKQNTIIKIDRVLPEPRRLFTFTSNGSEPLNITTAPKGEWDISHNFISNITFADDRPIEDMVDGGSLFRSTVIDGALKLTDVSESLELGRGRHLQFKDLKGSVQTTIGTAIKTRVIGKAGRIKAGPTGSIKDVTPKLFTYLLHHPDLSLWITIISFIGGAVWSARRLFVRS